MNLDQLSNLGRLLQEQLAQAREVVSLLHAELAHCRPQRGRPEADRVTDQHHIGQHVRVMLVGSKREGQVGTVTAVTVVHIGGPLEEVWIVVAFADGQAFYLPQFVMPV
jgi:hypothetical protein